MLAVHRSERADALVDALGDLLAEPLPDPIATEVVSVPTRGVERWLTQRLSHRLGVCANVAWPFPGTLVGMVTAAACGMAADCDPWRPEVALWPLVELLDEAGSDPVLAPLVAHLRSSSPSTRTGEPGPVRRVAAARHLVELWDHYGAHRPDLLVGWAAGGEEGGGGGADDGWQPHLWRQLRARIGVPSPAERTAEAARVLLDDPHVIDLPERLSLFGLTRLPPTHLDVLAAVAAGRDVHLYLLHPSARLWDAVADLAPTPGRGLRRADDPTTRLASHPLLRSWGRDARELQLVLAARGIVGGEHRPVEVTGHPDRLLGRLQADIRADRCPPGHPFEGEDRRAVLTDGDDSIRIHACHGRARQVEAVRDAILHLLAEHPDLELRDVIVMCPDIEAYAPLVHAAFATADVDAGSAAGVPAPDASGIPRLRVRLADRSLRQTNQLLSVAAALLTLAGSRVTASEVLDLASMSPVARRFRLDPDDLSTIEGWIVGTAVRWGLDAPHRSPWALDRLADGTWDVGLDRLLLGATMAASDAATWAATIPYEDVTSSAVDLAGRLAELLGRLRAAVDRLAGPHPVDGWIEALVEAAASVAEAADAERWEVEQLRRVLGEVGEEATAAATEAQPGPLLTLDEAEALLAHRLRGRPTRANFRTGDLTICTMVPMRSVPHRVVALVGLDDGAYPRHPEQDGDDLLLADPRVGERDARSEDRQLLLDALLAATDHLIVTYTARDERTGRGHPPAVPLSELIDAIDATARTPAGTVTASDAVTVVHPLQGFDRRNFEADELGIPGPWGYDRIGLGGATAAAAQGPVPAWLPAALPPLHEPVIQLDALVSMLTAPASAFLRRRVGLWVSGRTDRVLDALPVSLDELEEWGVGDRLVRARLAGIDQERALAAEAARGLLPPGGLAVPVLGKIGGRVADLLACLADLGVVPGPAGSLDIKADLPDGRTLIGTVPDVRDGLVVACSYSVLAAAHRLTAWIRVLALGAAHPELALGTLTVGRGRGQQPPQVSRLGPLGGDAAERRRQCAVLLGQLVDLYDRGMCAPLPLPCKSSEAWAVARRRGGDDEAVVRAAQDRWDDGKFPGEQSDAATIEIRGGRVPLRVVLREEPLPDERGQGWAADERARLGVLAMRLWGPLLDHEDLQGAR